MAGLHIWYFKAAEFSKAHADKKAQSRHGGIVCEYFESADNAASEP